MRDNKAKSAVAQAESVTFKRVCCPVKSCGSKKVPVQHTERCKYGGPTIRSHRCRKCGCTFQSIED